MVPASMLRYGSAQHQRQGKQFRKNGINSQSTQQIKRNARVTSLHGTGTINVETCSEIKWYGASLPTAGT
jgi:hypothetical protein